jgi:hypothetical protein
MAALLLAIALAGFARSFYLRPLFSGEEQGLRPEAIVHGIVMTAWFVLLLAQTSLIASGKPALHRRLGIAGVALAVAVVLSLGLVILRQTMRGGFAADLLGLDLSSEAGLAFVSESFWGQAIPTTVAAAFLAVAIACRKRPEVHKRLMLLISIALVSPAFDRMAGWELFGGTDLSDPGLPMRVMLFHWVGLLLLLAAVVVHDLKLKRRLHPATISFFVAFVVFLIAVPPLVSGSSFGLAVARWLLTQGAV